MTAVAVLLDLNTVRWVVLEELDYKGVSFTTKTFLKNLLKQLSHSIFLIIFKFFILSLSSESLFLSLLLCDNNKIG